MERPPDSRSRGTDTPTLTRTTDQIEPTRSTDSSGVRPSDYQAGADHPAFAASRLTDGLDLPQLSITGEKEQTRMFDRADSNHDGILERSEIDRRLQDKSLGKDERRLLSETRESFDLLTGLSKTEPGHERGITREDMAEHRKRQFTPEHIEALQLPSERARVTDLAQGKMSKEQFDAFKKDMATFEERMKGNPQEVAKTYREVARLLEPHGGTAVDTSKMGRLAIDVMHQAAEPKSVKQGPTSNTCTLAALESRIYTRHPSEAARLVADVATSSRYTTADGARVDIDRQSVNTYPDKWRDAAKTQGDVRSHASQIFQVTAANVFQSTSPDGSPKEYRLRTGANGQAKEELVDRKTGRVEGNSPGITVLDAAKALQDLNKRITGADEPPFVIDLTRARTKDEFRQTLDQIGRDKNFPALLAVNTLNPPFRPEGVDISKGYVPIVPYHMIAVDPGSTRDTVAVNDQFGPERDREHPMDLIYDATKMPRELLQTNEWPEGIAKVLEIIDQRNAGKPIDPQTAKDFRMAMLEYTPEHMAAIDIAYKAQTGKTLSELLSRYLPPDDMKALGYRSNWFSSGYHRG